MKETDNLKNWIDFYKNLGDSIFYSKEEKAEMIALHFFEIPMKDRWRDPKTIEEWKSMANLYWKAGFFYHVGQNQDFDKVKNYYETARAIYLDTLKIETTVIADGILRVLGNTYAQYRDFEKAFQYLLQAKNICQKNKEWDKAAMATNGIGLMYTTKHEHEKAIYWYREGLSFTNLSPPTKALLLINLALSLLNSDQEEEALKRMEDAEKLLQEQPDQFTDSQKYENWGDLFENYGIYYQRKKQWEKAIECHRKNLYNYIKKYGGAENRQVAQSYLALSTLYNEQSSADSALFYAQYALRCLLPDIGKLDGNFDNPNKAALYSENTFYLIFEQKIRAYKLLLKQQPNDFHLLSKCLEACDLLFISNEILRSEYDFEDSKLYRQKVNRLYFETAISTTYQLWSLTRDSAMMIKAFQLADFARERLSEEAFLLKEKISTAGIPLETKLQLDSLRDRYVKLQSFIFENKEPGRNNLERTDSLESLLFRTQLSFNKLLRPFHNEDTDILSNGLPLTSISSLKKLILPEQALLEYFVGDSSLFVFTLTGGQMKMFCLPKPETLTESVQTLLKSVTNLELRLLNEDGPLFVSSSNELYNSLLSEPLAEIKEPVNSLLIIPDGVLCALPFEVLGKCDHPVGFKDFPYLLLNYNISYAYSSSLYVEQSNRADFLKKKPNPELFGGFAPDYSNDPSIKLTNAIEEVEIAAKLLKGKAFLNESASEFEFKKEASHFRILQLAMHALIESENPMFSRFLFSNSETSRLDHGEDNTLYAIELYNMNLPVELANLSACNSGSGPFFQGEGIMNLSRAFTYAGTPSTIMSLWQAPDRATKELMVSFYSYLSKPGTRKDVALRNSKLDFLKTCPKNISNPFYWAGFIGVGGIQSIFD